MAEGGRITRLRHAAEFGEMSQMGHQRRYGDSVTGPLCPRFQT